MTNSSPDLLDNYKDCDGYACAGVARALANRASPSPDLRQPQVEAESVDTREFRVLLADLIDASERDEDTYGKARQPFIAHIDSIITARVAAARQEGFRDGVHGQAKVLCATLAASQAAPAAVQTERNQDVSTICAPFGQQPNTASFEAWVEESGVGGIDKNSVRYLDSFTQVAWCAWQAGESQAAPAKAEGWISVPMEPTEEMVIAANAVEYCEDGITIGQLRAAIAAATSTPAKEPTP